jgi:hypothetical protein
MFIAIFTFEYFNYVCYFKIFAFFNSTIAACATDLVNVIKISKLFCMHFKFLDSFARKKKPKFCPIFTKLSYEINKQNLFILIPITLKALTLPGR